MSHTDPTPDDTELDVSPPEVPARVRTIAYFVMLALGVLVALVAGLAPIWLGADLADRLVRSTVVVTSVLGIVAGGLGTVYRPTR